MKTEKIIGILAIVGLAALALNGGAILGSYLVGTGPTLGDSEIGQGLSYGSMVCAYKNGQLVSCEHNTLTNNGTQLVVDRLTGGAGAAINYISIGNGTAVNSSSIELDKEINDTTLGASSGLNNLQDTTPSVNLDPVNYGNWSWSVLFTAGAPANGIFINTTGLYNRTAGGGAARTLFAGATFSSNVTLATNDQLNVSWYIFIQ